MKIQKVYVHKKTPEKLRINQKRRESRGQNDEAHQEFYRGAQSSGPPAFGCWLCSAPLL